MSNIHFVKTRDVYGFEVDARRSQGYRTFYEKFSLTSQRQVTKTAGLIEAGIFKNWTCSYARGKSSSENANYEQIAELIRDGLPTKSRGEVWLHLTGVASKAKLYEGVYESLLEPYEQAEAYDINNSPSTIQIEKDVPRTFPGYIWTPRGKQFQPSLRRLLRAYAMRNPRLGYCQSMNFIAGGLLIFLDEVDAFWLLCFVVEELLPDYFSKHIIGPQVDAEVLSELMAEQLPALRDHFDELGLNTVLVCTQWFMCLFIRTLPYECAFRIWDSLFLNGPKVLFEVGLAILKMHQNDLLAFTDTIDIVTHLGSCLTDIFDCSVLWDIPITPLEHKRIAACREIYKEKVQRDMRMKMDILDLMDVLPSSKFSREALEGLYAQYANVGTRLEIDIVMKGLPKHLFYKVILNIFPRWKEDEYFLDRIFHYFDDNNTGFVNFKKLISGLSVLCKGSNEEKLRMCFELFDKNGDGFIDREELAAMLTSVYKVWDDEPPPLPIPEPTKDLDKDKTKEKESESESFSLMGTPIFRTNSIRKLANSFPLLVRGSSSKNLLSTSSSSVPVPTSPTAFGAPTSAAFPPSSSPPKSSPLSLSPPSSPAVVRLMPKAPISEVQQATPVHRSLSSTSESAMYQPRLSPPMEKRRPVSPERERRPSIGSFVGKERSLSFAFSSLKDSSLIERDIAINTRIKPALVSKELAEKAIEKENGKEMVEAKKEDQNEEQKEKKGDEAEKKDDEGKKEDEKEDEKQDGKKDEKDDKKGDEKKEDDKKDGKDEKAVVKGEKQEDGKSKEKELDKPGPPKETDSQGREKKNTDFTIEVSCFVDMFFKLDANKDNKLDPDEFKEAVLLHPFILKIFNLDGNLEHHQHYDLKIRID